MGYRQRERRRQPFVADRMVVHRYGSKPGMRVLDLGCGRAMSSIFLRREFGVQVWATDLWFSVFGKPAKNSRRRRRGWRFPDTRRARSLPFAADFFDAIISIDSFPFYGTDELYLNYLARFVKPRGAIGIAGAGLMSEIEGQIPDALSAWWEPNMSCLHSAAWWHRHWDRTGIVDVELADSMPEGWQLWLQWQRVIAPENLVEIQAVESDRGRYLGYVRAVGRRRPDVKLDDLITSIPTTYVPHPLLRRGGVTPIAGSSRSDGRLLSCGRGEVECRARTWVGFDPNTPAVFFDNSLAGSETDPAAGIFFAGVQTVEIGPKMRCCCSGGIPMPLSLIAISQKSPSLRAEIAISGFSLQYFNALPIRFWNT